MSVYEQQPMSAGVVSVCVHSSVIIQLTTYVKHAMLQTICRDVSTVICQAILCFKEKNKSESFLSPACLFPVL